MRCPYCGKFETKVVDKRDNREEGITRRRRECLNCFKRFTTYERIEHVELDVIKKSGKMEKFNRDKLKRGILKAVNESEISDDQVCKLIDDIEMNLLNSKSTVIKSSDIGKLVLKRLKSLDPIAYMRFASVYKDFDSLDDFINELNLLKKKHG